MGEAGWILKRHHNLQWTMYCEFRYEDVGKALDNSGLGYKERRPQPERAEVID